VRTSIQASAQLGVPLHHFGQGLDVQADYLHLHVSPTLAGGAHMDGRLALAPVLGACCTDPGLPPFGTRSGTWAAMHPATTVRHRW
jgi:hypothetical protein